MNLHTFYQTPVLARIDKGMIFAYTASGLLITLADFSVFTLMFSFFNTGLLAATVVAYIVGLVVSYVLNRYWVFKKGADKQTEGSSLWRYATFLAVNLVITYAMLWFMESQFGITPYIGKFAVNFFMFFWIYLGNTFFVFRGIKTGPIQL